MKLSPFTIRLAMFGLAILALAFLGGGVSNAAPQYKQTGWASFYASHGKTASGQQLRKESMTAAHRTLPFGTHVKITNLVNHKSVIVVINDRGPFIRGRVIDLATLPARIIGLTQFGVVKVAMQVTTEPVGPTYSKI